MRRAKFEFPITLTTQGRNGLKSIGWCKKDITSLLTHCSCVLLAPTHRTVACCLLYYHHFQEWLDCSVDFSHFGAHFTLRNEENMTSPSIILITMKQGKSEGFESCDRPIVRKRTIWVKIGDVLSRVTLKFDGWPWKTIGHLSFAFSSFVQHFIAIGEFKL